MKRIPLVTVALALLLAGCVSYPVRFNGYVTPSARTDIVFSPGQSFFVLEEENATNPLFSQEVREKITTLLKEQGYAESPRENAQYFLAYGYSIQSGTVSGVRSEYMPPETGTINTYSANGTLRTSFIQYPGYTTYYPYRYTVYTSTLRLEAFDAQAMRGSNEKKVLWIGESHLTSQNPDLRETINYLLVGAFDHFGRNTRRSVTETLSPKDPRVKRLF